MNSTRHSNPDWIAQLPPVRGRLQFDQNLGAHTWFRVGGAADVLFRPVDALDLGDFLHHLPPHIPVTVIGVGSNLLVRDGGVRGVVIRLGQEFGKIEFDVATMNIGGGVLDSTAAQSALDQSRLGLEFLSGIPGTIGGALRMNAGAYGREMKDIVIHATVMDRQGKMETLDLDQLGFGYRHCSLPQDRIFLGAMVKAPVGDADQIAARMNEIKTNREASQPIRSRTGGSTFANPAGAKAWELIDQAGCRGLIRGGAQISQQHCNFLLNLGDATAADLEDLGEEVRDKVKATSGITLEWEIRRIGERT